MHWIGSRGVGESAAALVAGGADVNVRSHDGWCPLHLAALAGRADVVKVLLAAGADAQAFNAAGRSAVQMSATDEVRALLLAALPAAASGEPPAEARAEIATILAADDAAREERALQEVRTAQRRAEEEARTAQTDFMREQDEKRKARAATERERELLRERAELEREAAEEAAVRRRAQERDAAAAANEERMAEVSAMLSSASMTSLADLTALASDLAGEDKR